MDRHTWYDAQSWLKVDHISNPEDSSVLLRIINFLVLNHLVHWAVFQSDLQLTTHFLVTETFSPLLAFLYYLLTILHLNQWFPVCIIWPHPRGHTKFLRSHRRMTKTYRATVTFEWATKTLLPECNNSNTKLIKGFPPPSIPATQKAKLYFIAFPMSYLVESGFTWVTYCCQKYVIALMLCSGIILPCH